MNDSKHQRKIGEVLSFKEKLIRYKWWIVLILVLIAAYIILFPCGMWNRLVYEWEEYVGAIHTVKVD